MKGRQRGADFTLRDPRWHVDQRQEAEKASNTFAAGEFHKAHAHFIAAAALKPKPTTTEK